MTSRSKRFTRSSVTSTLRGRQCLGFGLLPSQSFTGPSAFARYHQGRHQAIPQSFVGSCEVSRHKQSQSRQHQ